MSAYQAEPVLTPAEVAETFRVDPKTVTRWAQQGRLVEAFRTPGGHRRFREADIQALLRGETPTPPTTTVTPRHSVGVEPVTAELRQDDPSIPSDARLAVVERSDARFGKVCTTDLDIARMGLPDIETSARGYAYAYGATYVPAVTR